MNRSASRQGSLLTRTRLSFLTKGEIGSPAYVKEESTIGGRSLGASFGAFVQRAVPRRLKYARYPGEHRPFLVSDEGLRVPGRDRRPYLYRRDEASSCTGGAKARVLAPPATPSVGEQGRMKGHDDGRPVGRNPKSGHDRAQGTQGEAPGPVPDQPALPQTDPVEGHQRRREPGPYGIFREPVASDPLPGRRGADAQVVLFNPPPPVGECGRKAAPRPPF